MIPISPQQNELLNVLAIYCNRSGKNIKKGHQGFQKREPTPLPSRAALAKQLGSTQHRVTSAISVLKKRGIIKISGHRLAQVVEIIAKTYIPAEHVQPEPETKITRESRRACLAFVTGHQPWQIVLGTRE